MSSQERFLRAWECRLELNAVTRIERRYGKEITDSESGSQTEVFGARLHPMQALWTAARLPQEVQPVSHLFP